ncbi:hypothetical protein IMZ48_41475 [Candidatus Bathyarchaeota archaeon]|nr:hypothetical protein [Candidatus Bathyarchaeota archaeon]
MRACIASGDTSLWLIVEMIWADGGGRFREGRVDDKRRTVSADGIEDGRSSLSKTDGRGLERGGGGGFGGGEEFCGRELNWKGANGRAGTGAGELLSVVERAQQQREGEKGEGGKLDTQAAQRVPRGTVDKG